MNPSLIPPASANRSTNVTGFLPSKNSFFSAISNLHFGVQIYEFSMRFRLKPIENIHILIKVG